MQKLVRVKTHFGSMKNVTEKCPIELEKIQLVTKLWVGLLQLCISYGYESFCMMLKFNMPHHCIWFGMCKNSWFCHTE